MSTTTARAECRLRRDAYTLAHAATRLPLAVRHAWATAYEGDPFPPGVEELVVEIRDAAASVVGAVGGGRRAPAEAALRDLTAAAEDVLALARGAWGGEEHGRGIRYRDGGYEVLADHDDPTLNPMTLLTRSYLFEAPCWGRLASALAEFTASLPDSLHHLTVLGETTASALDFDLRHTDLVARRGRVQRRLLDSSDHRLRPIYRAVMSPPPTRAGQEVAGGPATRTRHRPYFDPAWPSEAKLRARLSHLHRELDDELGDPDVEHGHGHRPARHGPRNVRRRGRPAHGREPDLHPPRGRLHDNRRRSGEGIPRGTPEPSAGGVRPRP